MLILILFVLFLYHYSKIQECLGILAARCASCNCMTHFYCAPLQSCQRLYQLGGIDSQLIYHDLANAVAVNRKSGSEEHTSELQSQ